MSARPHEATIFTETGSPVLVIQAVRRRGDKLVIEGKALGSMYMDMLLSPGDFVRMFRVICSWGLIAFLLLLPFHVLAAVFRTRALRRPAGGGH
ncbi:MAG: hypothetical protein M1274_09345 [Actinobacteria bacterium]|nr:hypothetical protein [Actinomycetota bacterium]